MTGYEKAPDGVGEFNWDEKPHEACGVFGIYQPKSTNLAQQAYMGILGLQHRGQDAAGIAVFDSTGPIIEHNLGLVEQAIPDNGATLDAMNPDSRISLAHVRYSTVNVEDPYASIQPLHDPKRPKIALAHNGHIPNIDEVTKKYCLMSSEYSSDSDALVQLISKLEEISGLDAALDELLPQLNGSYSLVISDGKRLIGIRDPNGFRPLVLGEFNSEIKPGYILSSEDSALPSNATFKRDILPGEIIQIDEDGITSRKINKPSKLRICSFEFAYFARPDSNVEGRNVYMTRERAGVLLAREQPAIADIVIGMPDTGIQAAIGFAEESKLPYKPGVFKNPYTGRTFINPTQISREEAIRLKLRPNEYILKGNRVAVCDDSIVRGNTMRIMIESLREAGASEVHIRISSPPYRWPCFYGMDTGNPEELLAAYRDVEEMREYLKADSLGFISHEGFQASIGLPIGSLCLACTDGDYPTDLPASAIPVNLLNRNR